MDRKEVVSFGKKAFRFMETHGCGFVMACCHLTTYPNDTHYCSGHGKYGDNRDSNDCPAKKWCEEIAKRRNKNV
jgi:hypothetical protein